jgi:hypothetical protein
LTGLGPDVSFANNGERTRGLAIGLRLGDQRASFNNKQIRRQPGRNKTAVELGRLGAARVTGLFGVMEFTR